MKEVVYKLDIHPTITPEKLGTTAEQVYRSDSFFLSEKEAMDVGYLADLVARRAKDPEFREKVKALIEETK